MAGLMLDTADGWKRGGKSGKPSVTPDDPEHSMLLAAIRREGALKMPPGAPLSPEQISPISRNRSAWARPIRSR